MDALTRLFGKTPSVESIVIFFNKNPFLPMKVLTKKDKKVTIIQKMLSSSLILVFIASIVLDLSPFDDLYSFLQQVNFIVHAIFTCCVLWSVWLAENPALGEFTDIDSQLGVERVVDSDPELYAWLLFQAIFGLIDLVFNSTLIGIRYTITNMIPIVMAKRSIAQVYLMKNLVVKRLDIAVNREEEDLTKIMPMVRSIMDINDRTNAFYSDALGMSAITSFALAVWNAGDLWVTFTVRGESARPSWFSAGYAVFSLATNFELALIAWKSSAVSPRIQRLSDRMDRRITVELPPGDPHRHRLMTAIWELDLLDPAITGIDLFTIGTDSVFPYLELFVNISFVLVQFL